MSSVLPQAPAEIVHRRQVARPRREAYLYLLGFASVGLTWLISRLGLFEPWSRTGYWIGVMGGVCMLSLFTYPMRKHFKWMQRFGPAKHWFSVHMVLGILGPLLILLHSTFRIGSLNAGVALISMIVVAVSGVVGRFIYVRIHQDLTGEKRTLEEQKAAIGMRKTELNRQSVLSAEVIALLVAFEEAALSERSHRIQKHLWRLFVLPLRRWIVAHRCNVLVRQNLLSRAKEKRWSRKDYSRRKRRTQQQLADYLLSVQRVAQFSSFDRLFSLWHVAHVPFVWIMVICAMFHVVAVHSY